MEEAARQQGIELAWTQVDREGEAGVRRVLNDARFIIVDAPRGEDQAEIERFAGERLRAQAAPFVSVNVMNPPQRMWAANLDEALARRFYDYYVTGTSINHTRMFQYLRALIDGGDPGAVPAPEELPAGGIYHPGYAQMIFSDPAAYLAWWEQRTGRAAQGLPVIGVEISSGSLSDGQYRMLDEIIQSLEARGAVPLVYYRTTRARSAPASVATPRRGSREMSNGTETGPGFPNPKPAPAIELEEPLITLDGRIIVNVLLVSNFLGNNPDARMARYQAMGIPVINILSYRSGNRAEYLRDRAGVNSFSLPFTLTTAEYIGMQDPVMLTTNEDGELVPLPEQLEMLTVKAVNLARLQLMANAEKRVALLFWNHPPGEKNQGASNMNVPRSIEYLIEHLRAQEYSFDQAGEQRIIETVGEMLRPAYRKGGLDELMKTAHWDFLPLDVYKKWYATLPAEVRADIERQWGGPESSAWLEHRDGARGFVIPRMKLGNLVVMPQPARGEMSDENDEKKLFHDTKMPVGHAYLAGYLWIRQQFGAHAIIHFGTHGTQEWTPGKERGLWAYDYPNILVGDVPVVYPYIVDNIGEAIHVKRRGRGLIVSYQTPPFAPAGLSDDFVRINDLIREYHALDQGLVRDNNRALILDQAVKMNMHKDMGWSVTDLEGDFDARLRDIEDYLEDLGSAMQPLGLHTLGQDAERDFLISNVMQMLGQPLYERLGVDPKALFRADFRTLQQTMPYRFVADHVFSDRSLDGLEDARLRDLAARGRKFAADLHAASEIDAVGRGLAARWVDPSYGGDPIRNPDALPTGRNMYGFDPSRVPTRAAYEAGRQALDNLILTYRSTHDGEFPEKLAFSMWSTETMRHLGMLEAQILWAMGVRPQWDEGGRVTGLEVIPQAELGRPRIDPVISITGLYRDQFPNIMERFNEAIVMLANLDEPPAVNFIRANSERIKVALLGKGFPEEIAAEFALTRIFGTESGDYGTRLPQATLASDQWEEGDGKLEALYLARMSWAYGPDSAQWSRKLHDESGNEINTYAEHLRGTSAVVFSRSSNLRGMLDTDHPFEYLGGISLAVRQLDGVSPQLYISNMRDPNRARLETAEKFLAKELRAVYQHPNWVSQMQKEGYAGTLQMLNTINNFWGWQTMDRNVVRDDQWQEFHEVYVNDRYDLGLREWFEQSNPAALAQIAERMLEAIRKGYWQAGEQTRRELVEVYQEIARAHDVATANETFKAYVAELAQGYGLDQTAPANTDVSRAPQEHAEQVSEQVGLRMPEIVRGQKMEEVARPPIAEPLIWSSALFVLAIVLLGMSYQAWRTQRELKTI
jgi:cobaltochelatase CobN